MVVEMPVLFKSEELQWLSLLKFQSKGSKKLTAIAKFQPQTLALQWLNYCIQVAVTLLYNIFGFSVFSPLIPT